MRDEEAKTLTKAGSLKFLNYIQEETLQMSQLWKLCHLHTLTETPLTPQKFRSHLMETILIFNS